VRPPISFVYGNCVFGRSLDDRWAVFAVSTRSYDGLRPDRKRELFLSLLAAIEALDADVQIMRVSRRWDPRDYAAQLHDQAGSAHPELSLRYIDAHLKELQGRVTAQPCVFVAVSLAEPERDVATYVSRAVARSPREWWEACQRALAGRDRRILSVTELEQTRVRSDQAHARLANFIDVRPAGSAEIQWLVRRAFCRGLGEPTVDGLDEPRALIFERNGQAVLAPLEGDLVRWSDSYIEHRGRMLRVESELGTSWQCQLVAGALPERAAFPGHRVELMFAPPEGLDFGIDLSLNARFLPNELALRMVRRRIQDADQIVRAESDGDQGVSDRGYERSNQARDLLAYLQAPSRPPLLRATLAIAVSAGDEQELEARVELCRRAYGEVRLHRPLGEQLELFCQHLPGQRSRVGGYDDTLTPEQVAAMMPIAAHAVGSRSGFYLGHTLSRSRQPVRLNLREGSDTDHNTTILSVGALGSGKTTLDQKLKYEAFLQGARIVDCDPKGDHRFHELTEVAPHCEVLTLRPDPALRGVLDPLRVAPTHLRQDAAVSFLRDLLPVRAEAAWETAVVQAVDNVIRRSRVPTCLEVVQALAAGDEVDRQVAKTLEVYARAGLTQLGFADPAALPAPAGHRQVTYLPIRDLPSPEPGVAREHYSQTERVGEQIVRLIAMFAMQLMGSERDRLKVFSFDEGWRLLKDPIGRTLLMSLQRLGRSELAVPIISTQLVTDTILGDRESLDNLLGAVFVFGMRSEAEASRALTLLGLDPSDRRMIQRLLEFKAGRCLFRDHAGRVEAIQVELLVPGLLRAFSTTPPRAGSAAGGARRASG
jgi:hypothetical protein